MSKVLTAAAAALVLAFVACGDRDEYDGQPIVETAGGMADLQPQQMSDSAALAVDTLDGVGAYLTDGNGKALYLFTADTKGASESSCYGECAIAWPPFLSPGGATPAANVEAIDESMIGTIQRRDGSMQVTYNGWPLYYYEKDKSAGTTTGQDVRSFGGEWYVVGPSGEKLQRK